MTRITAAFTAQVLEALRAASLEELSARRPPAVKQAAPKKTKRAAKQREARQVAPDRSMIEAALRFFSDRGRKGATPDQLSAHLGELGFSKANVLGALLDESSIRDAGFRRSTGVGNKTSPVYVSSR